VAGEPLRSPYAYLNDDGTRQDKACHIEMKTKSCCLVAISLGASIETEMPIKDDQPEIVKWTAWPSFERLELPRAKTSFAEPSYHARAHGRRAGRGVGAPAAAAVGEAAVRAAAGLESRGRRDGRNCGGVLGGPTRTRTRRPLHGRSVGDVEGLRRALPPAGAPPEKERGFISSLTSLGFSRILIIH